MSPTRRSRGFSLVELLAAIAIVAILTLLALFFTVGYTQWARSISDQRTLLIYNDALNRYKTEGGSLAALTQWAPINHVIATLQTPVVWVNITHQFIQSGVTATGRSFAALGSGATYRFTQYNTYTAETNGKSPSDLGPTSGSLVDWWQFDESSGTSASDSSGHSHTGTLHGGASFVPGHSGNALSLDGTSGYISLSAQGYGNIDYTVAAWIKTNADGFAVSNGESTGDLRVVSGCGWLNFNGGGWENLAGSTHVNDNQWHHLVGVRQGNTLTLYVDGSQNATESLTGSGNFGVQYVGQRSNGQYFSGLIDEVRVYNRALSSSEVQQLYSY